MRGEIHGFTGVDDPYERPHAPELTLDTVDATAEANARAIVSLLRKQGYVR